MPRWVPILPGVRTKHKWLASAERSVREAPAVCVDVLSAGHDGTSIRVDWVHSGSSFSVNCSVVWKLAPEMALDGQFLGDLFTVAGLAAGVLSIVGPSREVSEHLVTHRASTISPLPGPPAAGQRLASLAGAQLKRVSLELGGKSAAIILEDADIEATV